MVNGSRVRYRYYAQRKKRFKTVELIVVEREWKSPPAAFCADAMEGLRVDFTEVAPREQVKQAGSKWHRSCKV